MPDYFAVFWIPYLLFVFHFYKKRSVYAPILLISVGMLQYKLPLIFIQGIEPEMWFIGVMLCVAMSFADIAISKKISCFWDRNADTKLKKYITIYLSAVLFSVIVMSPYPIIKKITFGVDYAILALIVMQCVKNRNDVFLMLKGVLFGALLMAAIGFIGYFLDDPYWGHTISSDQTDVIYAKSVPGLTYSERLRYQAMIVKDYKFVSELSLRPRFTSSSPNDLGVTMLMVIPLLLMFYLRIKKNFYKKIVFLTGATLLLAAILLTGSRTTLMAGCLFMPLLFVLLFKLKYVKKLNVLLVLSFFLFGVIPMLLSSSVADMSMKRVDTIQDTGDVMDGNGRLSRWTIHLKKLNTEILLFGNGQIGSTGGGSTIAHSNYLSTLYRGGGLALISFLLCFYQCRKVLQQFGNKLLSTCLFMSLIIYAFTSIPLDLNVAVGPPFIFWTLVGLIAKSSNTRGFSKKIKFPQSLNIHLARNRQWS